VEDLELVARKIQCFADALNRVVIRQSTHPRGKKLALRDSLSSSRGDLLSKHASQPPAPERSLLRVLVVPLSIDGVCSTCKGGRTGIPLNH
jgi:hypothetical protein